MKATKATTPTRQQLLNAWNDTIVLGSYRFPSRVKYSQFTRLVTRLKLTADDLDDPILMCEIAQKLGGILPDELGQF